MTTKSQVLRLIEEHRGNFLSGEEIAEELSLSRTAVWKAVNILRKEGHLIQAVPKKGYCLEKENDVLSKEGLMRYLRIKVPLSIEVYQTIDSTNRLGKEKGSMGEDHLVILAASQSKGRGRLGRSFFSPKDTGIYMSILLRPEKLSMEKSIQFTTMAAVAACNAIETVSGEKAEIKWVNDIYFKQKKVSGILTEASLNMEEGTFDYVVLGIGMNLYPPRQGFPKDIKEKAGSIFQAKIPNGKNKMAAEFLNQFFTLYQGNNLLDYSEEYKKRSMVLNKQVYILSNQKPRKVKVLDIDRDCHLHVEDEHGNIQILSSGEISLDISELLKQGRGKTL